MNAAKLEKSDRLRRVCLCCGKSYLGKGTKYCSQKCNGAHRAIPRVDAFHAGYEKVASGCWEWRRATHYRGYGQVTHKPGEEAFAHRFSYAHFNGEIPEGMMVLHTCHNRKCVNPQHLYIGTASDNSKDMVRAGRQQKGERVWSAKINENEAKKIMAEPGRYYQIATKYGVSRGIVSCIKRGRTWKHVFEQAKAGA